MTSLLDKPDGQPLGPKRTITAAEQAAMLGLKKSPVKSRPLPLTPAQARREQSGNWRGDDLDPPDYAAGVVSGAEAVAAAMGARPEDFDSAPLGSMPEGQPVPAPAVRPKIEPRPERQPEGRPPMTAEQADELRAMWRKHEADIRKIAEAAKGDPAKEARAAQEIAQSAEVGARIKRKLGGVL